VNCILLLSVAVNFFSEIIRAFLYFRLNPLTGKGSALLGTLNDAIFEAQALGDYARTNGGRLHY
jgi:hypothetical protein